ncbi:cytochrome c oxidase subunit 3 [Pseudosulfitobacter koreensis]|uniref:Cytochrome c oxidase subunit 3 n=1 Tax=Pseudosulfitobacter koreensis TaxID=2968472 RepID=A0ABT1YWZ6_9RHOB|nr:cytochrome c oxidase subunit 3 [Pseudosulfitobacter koreense]MCR8825408.1 cytochrome c oxidase subunit 3 [Pseudosulfitobacter koreense]
MSRHPGLNLDASHAPAHDQAVTLVFGFWVFMMSDVIVFGLLFATYVAMSDALAGGPGPHDLFELRTVFIETLLLLISSLTIGMASLSMKHERDDARLFIWLGLTFGLGLAFLSYELHDFASMVEKGGVPSRSGWLSAFWALVPLHALHVSAAMLWLVVIAVQVLIFGQDSEVKLGLLRLTVLWHFLDIVWIGIFTIVYLGELG